MVHFVALPNSPMVMFPTSKRPRPTMRYPPHKSEPCYVKHRSRSASFADSSLVYLARSPSVFLFLSEFLADKCVFQVMSINKSMSSNKKLLSLVKLVKLFVSCIQNCYTLQKIFGPEPRWGAQRPPPPPPDPHLQSTSIHRWLRP